MSKKIKKVTHIKFTCPKEGCKNFINPVMVDVRFKSSDIAQFRECFLHEPIFKMNRKFIYGDIEEHLVDAEQLQTHKDKD